MTFHRHLLVVAMVLAWSAGATLSADPPSMTKVVYRDTSPGIDPNSFAAKPRTMYRVGDKLGRGEEVPNPATGLHLLFIVNHPDVWIVNLADKTARHTKDPDPKGVFRVPVILRPDLPMWTKEFEIGREVEFFNAEKARKAGTEKVAGKECNRLVLEKDKVELTLWVDAKEKVPVRLRVGRDGKVLREVEYDKYETGLKPPADFFAPPKGIAITEAK